MLLQRGDNVPQAAIRFVTWLEEVSGCYGRGSMGVFSPRLVRFSTILFMALT